MAPRNDIAIHAPFAFPFYEDRAARGEGAPRGGGGAELQTSLLAEALARRGLRVAHIIYQRERPAEVALGSLELIERKRWEAPRGVQRTALETLRVWRSLADADARLYLFRGGGGAHLAVGAAFCALHRRRLVFSASNDFDFIRRTDRGRFGQAVYRAALRRARCVVVQTAQQLELARRSLGTGAPVELIPSFAEITRDPADNRGVRAFGSDHRSPSAPYEESAGIVSPPEPEGFLWAARLVPYKLPLRYVELARAVPEARFRMIAPTTVETTDELSQQVTEAADELPNLELLPPQWRETVLEMIRRSVAVVVTSRTEGMPNVFLEAWSQGVPVISLHFDPDGKISSRGLGLFADGSWDRFVEAARTLWRDPRLRRDIGDRARAYVAAEHSFEAVGRRWAEALRDALS